MTIDRSKNLRVFWDESPVLDVRDEEIQYKVSDFALGTGFSKARPFKGELADFHLGYKKYRKNPAGDYLVVGALFPPLFPGLFLLRRMIRRGIGGAEIFSSFLRKWNRIRLWKAFCPVLDGKVNFNGAFRVLGVFTAALLLLQVSGLGDLRITGLSSPEEREGWKAQSGWPIRARIYPE